MRTAHFLPSSPACAVTSQFGCPLRILAPHRLRFTNVKRCYHYLKHNCAAMPNMCPFPPNNYFSMSRPKMALYGLHKWHCTHNWHCLTNQNALYAQLALCVLHKRHCIHNWHCIDGKNGIVGINGIVLIA